MIDGAPKRGDRDYPALVRHEYKTLPENAYSYYYEFDNGEYKKEQGAFFEVDEETKVLRIIGEYSYTGDDGELYKVSYTSDERGFLASGVHLPVSNDDYGSYTFTNLKSKSRASDSDEADSVKKSVKEEVKKSDKEEVKKSVKEPVDNKLESSEPVKPLLVIGSRGNSKVAKVAAKAIPKDADDQKPVTNKSTSNVVAGRRGNSRTAVRVAPKPDPKVVSGDNVPETTEAAVDVDESIKEDIEPSTEESNPDHD